MAICGSDLHLYGAGPCSMHKNDALGHEFMGVVEEVAPSAPSLKPADWGGRPLRDRVRALLDVLTAALRRARPRRCVRWAQGRPCSGSRRSTPAPGGQAEMVRAPHADFGPVKLPQDFDDERFLYLSDCAPRGRAVKYANVGSRSTLRCWTSAPRASWRRVRQAAGRAARHRGGPRRRAPGRGQELGVETVDLREVDDVSETLRR
ncbi:alcohol dehydrogenase catalytic domain-containing protein [Kocuria rhizophila]|nr:alcohol dehydrogenase catalytic domain-containing protein [Kocuria rhizophila]